MIKKYKKEIFYIWILLLFNRKIFPEQQNQGTATSV